MASSADTPTAASIIPEISADPVAAVRAGLPYAALEHVREHLEASDDLLAQALGISSRTLSRRRETGTLSTDESDRLVVLIRTTLDSPSTAGVTRKEIPESAVRGSSRIGPPNR